MTVYKLIRIYMDFKRVVGSYCNVSQALLIYLYIHTCFSVKS